MNAKRLFVSLELPHSVTERLAELDPHLRGVRWLEPEQMHLTLSFLGNVPGDVEEALKKNLEAIEWKSFFLPIYWRRSLSREGPANMSFGSASAPGIRIFSNCTNACRKPPSTRDSSPICARFIRTSLSRVAGMFPRNPCGLFFERTPRSMPE